MSQFDFPRIHVKGQFYYNPGTANNDSIDPTESGPTTANTETVQPVSNGMNDDEFKRWLTRIDPGSEILNGQWNVYGDMSMWFHNVIVSSVQTSHDKIFTSCEDYPLIGAELTINKAFAIDVNPEGFSTTEVFCDSFSFKGSKEALGANQVWTSQKPSRAATRWINWYRNLSYHGIPDSSGAAGGVSATWQMAIPLYNEDEEHIDTAPRSNLFENDLKKISDGFAKVNAYGNKLQGMIFRMNVYLCSPQISDAELYNNYFAKGIPKENPAIGRIIGTFAPWYENEMKSITLTRFLNSAHSFSNPYSSQSFPGNQAYLAPVLAYVDKIENVISLDLANTFPEDGPDGKKFEMGKAILEVKMPDDILITIGEFRYDRRTYELTGGLVDIKYDPLKTGDIEQGLLAVSLTNYKQGPLLLENEYMIATDNSCVYLNEDKSKNRDIIIRGCFKGEQLKEPLGIEIDQWQMTPTYQLSNTPKCLAKISKVIPVDGVLPYSLETLGGPGVRIFRFRKSELPTEKLNIITDYMCAVRVLPKNDYSHIPDDALNFDLIYREIFRYYNLILPGMNKYLPMDDATVWNSPTVAEYVLKKSREDQWEEFHYMPRTRDLSDSRRELLHKFCKKIIREHANDREKMQ